MCAERLFWPRRPVSWLPAEKKTGLGEKLHLLLNLSKWGIPDMTNGEINTVAHCYFLASRLPLALALLSGSGLLVVTKVGPLLTAGGWVRGATYMAGTHRTAHSRADQA